MAHPYASQAKASQKRRLSALGAKPGSPSAQARCTRRRAIRRRARALRPTDHLGRFCQEACGSSRQPLCGWRLCWRWRQAQAEGPFDHEYRDRVSRWWAGCGSPGARCSPRSGQPARTCSGCRGAPPVPPRPMGPPGAGGPPIIRNVPPPAAAGPVGPPPGIRPPGMAGGGLIGSTYHNWGKGFANGGSVKKKANGGPVGGGQSGVPRMTMRTISLIRPMY
jgi:hypothetical protein